MTVKVQWLGMVLMCGLRGWVSAFLYKEGQ